MRLAISIFLSAFCLVANAQTYEPEFIGECNILTVNGTDTISVPLQKTKAYVKSKAGASLYLVGIGSVKTRIHMEGSTSNCKVKANQKEIIIVKVSDNNVDPNSFIEILKFSVKGDERRCEIGKSNTFGGDSAGNSLTLDFNAKKYGKGSFALYITPTEGEYAIRITNPNNRDEKMLMLYCFTAE